MNKCNDCVFNMDGFCRINCRNDLDEISECDDRIPLFDLAFYYDEEIETYRCVAYLTNGDNEIIRGCNIPQGDVIEMINREKEHLDLNESIIDKINKWED